MIILVSGYGRTGKTLMSQKLLEKYKIPYLSVDHLKMGLYRANSNCGFTPLDSVEVIGAKLWPILKGIIMTNIENNQHMIIEGCYLLPHFIKEFKKPYSDQIISVFLGFSTTYIKENFSDIIKHRSVIEESDYPQESDISEYINDYSEYRKKYLENGVAFFEIDNDYEEEIQSVYDFIENRVSETDYGNRDA
jgi:2-phosphoglycerate kinase